MAAVKTHRGSVDEPARQVTASASKRTKSEWEVETSMLLRRVSSRLLVDAHVMASVDVALDHLDSVHPRQTRNGALLPFRSVPMLAQA